MTATITLDPPAIVTAPLPVEQQETADVPSCCVCHTTEGHLYHCEGGALLDKDCDHYVCKEHRREWAGWCQIEYFLCPGCYIEQIT